MTKNSCPKCKKSKNVLEILVSKPFERLIVIRKYKDQNLPFRKFQLEKRLPKILGELFRVKIR